MANLHRIKTKILSQLRTAHLYLISMMVILLFGKQRPASYQSTLAIMVRMQPLQAQSRLTMHGKMHLISQSRMKKLFQPNKTLRGHPLLDALFLFCQDIIDNSECAQSFLIPQELSDLFLITPYRCFFSIIFNILFSSTFCHSLLSFSSILLSLPVRSAHSDIPLHRLCLLTDIRNQAIPFRYVFLPE